MKTVIIGGVAGGASAAARLRRLDEQAEIIMLERGDYISYANCGLPYYIGGAIQDQDDLTLQTPESFRARFAVDVRVRQTAVQIDAEKKIVRVRRLDDGSEYEEAYDHLILSPGAEPARPPLPGIDDSRIFTLRTIPDTQRIHDYIRTAAPKSAVIVGAGFIGIEMAENFSRAGLAVSIVEFAGQILAPFDADIAAHLHQYLQLQGVNLYLNRAVKGFAPKDDRLQVELSTGEALETDMVLLAVGVKPESGLAKAAGLETDPKGAILVDEHMKTSHPDIYAVGDAVAVRNFVTGEPAHVPLAGPANKQGRIAADNIAGIPSVYKGTQGSSVLKIFDVTAAATGLNEKAASAAGLAYDQVVLYPPAHATYYPGSSSLTMKVLFEKPGGRILGAQVLGQEGADKRCDVLAAAIRAQMTAVDLTELELCYAPPFSSAKDPVNMAGFMIENLLTGKVKQFRWSDVGNVLQNENAVLLDVRSLPEYQAGHIDGAVHIPLDQLRERIAELPADKTVYVHCQSGLRSYIACRILSQRGFDCYNLSGGYGFYETVTQDIARNQV